jgi:hypothetical protein
MDIIVERGARADVHKETVVVTIDGPGIKKDENDRRALENAADIFDWLELTGRVSERTLLLRRAVFPALLSDFSTSRNLRWTKAGSANS